MKERRAKLLPMTALNASDGHVAALRGLGGALVLYPDRLRIIRAGAWFNTVNALLHLERETESVILLGELTGVHLVRSLLLVQFVRLTYAGCPTPSGRYLRDAFAENAFMFSLTDNRPLVRMMHHISDLAAGATRPR